MSRVAIVSGGAGALGTAIVRELAGRGHRVVIAYRTREDEARALVESVGGAAAALAVAADLADPAGPETIVSAARAAFGDPTILVNNAGIMSTSPVEEMSDAQWDEMILVNLTSAFRLSRAVIPGMRAAGGGRILNVSSQAASRGSIGRAHYAAAKSGMLGFTYSLALELGPDAITVNAVVPGRFMSDMLLPHAEAKAEAWLAGTPLGRFGEPPELASAVGFLTSDEASYITGATLHVGGGVVMG